MVRVLVGPRARVRFHVAVGERRIDTPVGMLRFDPRLGGRREDAVEGRHQSFEVKRLQEGVRDSLQVILGIGGQRIPRDEQ